MNILLNAVSVVTRRATFHFPAYFYREKLPKIYQMLVKEIDVPIEIVNEIKSWSEIGFDVQLQLRKNRFDFTICDIEQEKRTGIILYHQTLNRKSKKEYGIMKQELYDFVF